MPFFRGRDHRWTLLGLVGIIMVCGFFVRASAPMPSVAALVATVAPTVLPPAATPAPRPKAAPADATAPAATPFTAPERADVLVSGASEVVFVDATLPPDAQPSPLGATAYAPPSVAIVDTAYAQEIATEPPAKTPSPPAAEVGDPPLYQYATEEVRIQVRRYDVKNTVYFTAEIWLTDASQLRSAFSSDRFDGATEPVRDIADRNGAILAINGDFATFNNGGIIIRNGDLFRSNRSTRHLLTIDKHGDLLPYTDPPKNAKEASAAFIEEGIWQTLVFGPVLVENGEPVPLPDDFFVSTGATAEPRTAIGQIGPLHYLWIVVDGRQDGYSRGVSLTRLQELFIEHGAQTAFNLDGGGSTTLYYDGNVINRPANGGQRHVPDILFIAR